MHDKVEYEEFEFEKVEKSSSRLIKVIKTLEYMQFWLGVIPNRFNFFKHQRFGPTEVLFKINLYLSYVLLIKLQSLQPCNIIWKIHVPMWCVNLRLKTGVSNSNSLPGRHILKKLLFAGRILRALAGRTSLKSNTTFYIITLKYHTFVDRMFDTSGFGQTFAFLSMSKG